MDWNEVKGKWNILKGRAKEAWGKLTDDDITFIDGTKDKLVGKLQEKYGWAKEEVESRISDFITKNGGEKREDYSEKRDENHSKNNSDTVS
jgi:uncharacterized protein YjbJ (UPF0337 family)